MRKITAGQVILLLVLLFIGLGVYMYASSERIGGLGMAGIAVMVTAMFNTMRMLILEGLRLRKPLALFGGLMVHLVLLIALVAEVPTTPSLWVIMIVLWLVSMGLLHKGT